MAAPLSPETFGALRLRAGGTVTKLVNPSSSPLTCGPEGTGSAERGAGKLRFISDTILIGELTDYLVYSSSRKDAIEKCGIREKLALLWEDDEEGSRILASSGHLYV
jgi:hypothetical protein